MPNSGVQTPRKRIYNPRTGKYYALRLQSSTEGRQGTIQGLWKNPKQPFTFYKALDQPLGVSVESVRDLGEKIQSIDLASLEFHLERGDFAAWIHYLGNTDLAKRLRDVEAEDYQGERLREQLNNIIAK